MLISETYRRLNAEMHRTTRYGVGGHRMADKVRDLAAKFKCSTVLDYGCGKGTLKDALGGGDWVAEYDPAIAGKDGEPVPADLVVCTDVLEHIEPECLDSVLDDLRRLSVKAVFLVVHTGPARKVLPDGRNAHLTQQPGAWWEEKFAPRWDRRFAFSGDNGFAFVGVPK